MKDGGKHGHRGAKMKLEGRQADSREADRGMRVREGTPGGVGVGWVLKETEKAHMKRRREGEEGVKG